MSNITHPPHYNTGKIEVIEVIEVIEAIEDWKLNFHRGNAVKYTARAGKKDPAKEIEDLEKAKWYLEREIETLKASKDGREPVRPNDMNPRGGKYLPPEVVSEIEKKLANGDGSTITYAKYADAKIPHGRKATRLDDAINIVNVARCLVDLMLDPKNSFEFCEHFAFQKYHLELLIAAVKAYDSRPFSPSVDKNPGIYDVVSLLTQAYELIPGSTVGEAIHAAIEAAERL